MILLLTLLACGSETPWWEAEAPCPPGAELVGTPWPSDQPITSPPGPLPSDRREVYTRRYAVMCRKGEGPGDYLGRSTSWWGNGQRQMDFTAAEDGVAELTEWDELGRQTHHRVCAKPGERDSCTGERTYWHHNGQKGIEGAYAATRPTGTWKEWNLEGDLIGEVVFTEAGPQVKRHLGTRLLVADIAHAGRSSLYVTDSPELTLPTSSAITQPVLGVSLVMTSAAVIVDGAWVGDWEDDGLRRQLRRLLREKRALEEKIAARVEGMSVDLRVLVQADASRPFADVADLLRVAAEVGYITIDIVVTNPQRKLPPFEGPPRTQNLAHLSVLTVTSVDPAVPGALQPKAGATLQEVVRASDAIEGPVRWAIPRE